MAKFAFDIDPAFARLMERVGNFDEIAPRVLSAGGSVLLTYVKNGIKASGHEGAGELRKSLRMKVFQGKTSGWYASVNPLGYSNKYKDKNGAIKTRAEKVSNAQKLIAIEYGTRYQDAKPFLQKAVNDAMKDIEDVMQKEFEEVVLDGR